MFRRLENSPFSIFLVFTIAFMLVCIWMLFLLRNKKSKIAKVIYLMIASVFIPLNIVNILKKTLEIYNEYAIRFKIILDNIVYVYTIFIVLLAIEFVVLYKVSEGALRKKLKLLFIAWLVLMGICLISYIGLDFIEHLSPSHNSDIRH